MYQVKVKSEKSLSCVRLFVTPWTVACQAPMSTGYSRQEYWCGLPFPSPGDLPNPGIEPRSPALQADSLLFEPPGQTHHTHIINLLNTKSESRIVLLHIMLCFLSCYFPHSQAQCLTHGRQSTKYIHVVY